MLEEVPIGQPALPQLGAEQVEEGLIPPQGLRQPREMGRGGERDEPPRGAWTQGTQAEPGPSKKSERCWK